MTDRGLSWLMMGIGTGQVLLLVLALVYGLRDHGLSKPKVRPGRNESRCCPALTAAQKLGATIMSVVDTALARFSEFVKSVLGKVKDAQESNDVQTAKLAELQAALDAATADDAKIAELQSQVSGLQEEVAAKINAVVDALENPPVEAVEEAPVVEESDPVVEEVVEEVPVVEDAEVPVVEEDAVVVEEAVVVDPVEPTVGGPVE